MAEAAHTRPGVLEAVAIALRHYADFAGRATRPEFWWYALFQAFALSVCGVFNFIEPTPSVTVGSVLAAIFTIVTLLPSLAVALKRLRDAGAGWGHILWLLVPVAGIVILGFYLARPTQTGAPEETEPWGE